jgi:hypothetical protein
MLKVAHEQYRGVPEIHKDSFFVPSMRYVFVLYRLGSNYL